MRWIEHPGYLETHWYVDAQGRIVAEVYGSRLVPTQGWSVTDTTTTPSTLLGRYVTLEAARQAAVEHYQDSFWKCQAGVA